MNTIGRYQPKKKIGSGSQGTVYLCLDPQLKRKVAIKLLNKPFMGGETDAAAFEREAEALGKFQHQNIVTVYDVGQFKGRPYIVFEYIQGQLLSDLISQGKMALPRVMEFMTGIVEGVSKAHKAGVVHRDLKPQNIIINGDGLAKIMDFGIALLVDGQEKSESLVGTPRYMAPEYIRQQLVSPSIDVFSLGAIFYEMLTGKQAFVGKTTSDVLARVLMGPPKPPSNLNDLADDVIDGMCLKSLAANSADRYQDADKFLDVLKTYQKDHQEIVSVDGQGKATLEFLYRRMQRKKDFPALADSIRTINELQANSEKDAEKVAAIIVNDFALTNKILKVVNSAYYGSFSGKISTISRAIVVLGVDNMRSMAASLIFFDHMSDRSVARKLKHQMASSLFRAIFAQEFTSSSGMKGVEESFLCAMFYELGSALVTYYLPEEDKEIELLMAKGNHTESEVTMQVMGVTYEDVGAFVARQWNFPEMIVHSMEKPEPGKPADPETDDDKYRLITHLADKATTILSEGGSIDDVKKVVSRYEDVLPVKMNVVEEMVENARAQFAVIAEKLVNDKPVDNYVMKLQGMIAGEDKASEDNSSSINLDSVLNDDEDASDEFNAEAILSQGLQEATNIILETGDVSQVFNTVLETLYRAMTFRRVFLCLKKGNCYSARLGFGEDIKESISSFKLTLDGQKNVFSVALEKSVDVYIADVNDKKIRSDLPKWFFRETDAGSFVLFPLKLKGNSIGFIYGEYARANEMVLESKTFNLIKSLRNQMIMALR